MLKTCQTCGQVLYKLQYFAKLLQMVLKMWQYGMQLHAGFFILLGHLNQDFLHFNCMNKISTLCAVNEHSKVTIEILVL